MCHDFLGSKYTMNPPSGTYILKQLGGDHFNFSSDFPSDRNTKSQLGSRQMSNLVETHTLKGLILECLIFDAHNY